ncbi:hypothetical protein [Roseibium aggregatum]|uniref:Uncharacterized protein n=1 Tax=Roseibium aggregatum TaxID=187304 RepID=A0A926NX64_9HYPH|nr:hypothetical protein [Roseibium aggregatum]MBD1544858.1 hypothetical protein [Roseibium aggregatum]
MASEISGVIVEEEIEYTAKIFIDGGMLKLAARQINPRYMPFADVIRELTSEEREEILEAVKEHLQELHGMEAAQSAMPGLKKLLSEFLIE